MAQLVLGAAGSAIGEAALPEGLKLLGSHFTGEAIGGFVGATLGGYVDRALFGQSRRYGPRLSELHLQASTDGVAIPLVFGRARIAGQVIWAARLKEIAEKSSSGGKGGGPTQVDYRYSISFAVGLCEGEISGLGRIWANGALLDQSGVNYRLYSGSQDQLPDSLIEAIEGASNTPAFRGLAYIVFEDLQLDAYGARIPNLSFEVFRSPQTAGESLRLEDRIHGVDLIPASGEFAYSTQPIVREISPGRDAPENQNNGRGQADLLCALDDLEAQLPNCKSILLVSAWFGDDLRCGACSIRPGVETRNKVTRPISWQVAGHDRTSAYLITQIDDRPVYGGTPSDQTLIAAMQEMKARGFSVSLYPFILMDIPGGNGLPDPWGGAEQAAFPWRGRITCDPAPGVFGSVDQTAAARTQVDNFFGTASAGDFSVSGDAIAYSGPFEFGFRRFILHHAALAKAGGADGFLIGSEMRALTQIRDDAGFPAVDQLCALAGEARAVLGSNVRLSYAADWSEYFGYHPQDGSGDVWFHLDDLWGHPDIDAIAIDWYVPLSDWRDGSDHLDAALTTRPHDFDYLSANMEGGEGYDWYYASTGDRDAQIRSDISDGTYGKPWVFRYKDIRNWWSNPHYNRVGGVELGSGTAWVPRSKPIWFTEMGCPAIDKGANQPNVFVDPKSAESSLPYYSDGSRDDLIQRRYLEATLAYWDESAGHNPQSSIYDGTMVDTDNLHVWTWDARPFPDFPACDDVWADGANWQLGHWITGRTGLAPLVSVVDDLSSRTGVEANLSGLDGLVSGFVLDQAMSARAALEVLSVAYRFNIIDGSHGVVMTSEQASSPIRVDNDTLVLNERGSTISRTADHAAGLVRNARIRFIEDRADYAPGSVQAFRLSVPESHVLDVAWPLLADVEQAREWGHELLVSAHNAANGLSFALPPSRLAVEAGDPFILNDMSSGTHYEIQHVAGLVRRTIEAREKSIVDAKNRGPLPGQGGRLPTVSRPDVRILDIALQAFEAQDRGGPLVAIFSDPWPSSHSIHLGASPSQLTVRNSASKPAVMGVVEGDCLLNAPGRWDCESTLTVTLSSGALFSHPTLDVLNGVNRLAIEVSPAEWISLQFCDAELIGQRQYRLRTLVHDMLDPNLTIPDGAPVVVMDSDLVALSLLHHEFGEELSLAVGPSHLSINATTHHVGNLIYSGADIEPLAPVHINALRKADGIHISWIRRTRLGGDDWSGADVPLGESVEEYQIDFWDDETILETRTSSKSGMVLDSADELAIFGASVEVISVGISQISSRYGAGASRRADLQL